MTSFTQPKIFNLKSVLLVNLCLVSLALTACGDSTPTPPPPTAAPTTAPAATTLAIPPTTPPTTAVAGTTIPPTPAAPTTAAPTTVAPTTAAPTTAAATTVPATTAASGTAGAAVPLAADEQEVTFTSQGDTIYGTLLIPKNATGKIPVALLLSGSGPTDRNGNNPLINGLTNSHLEFARVLAGQGVASLRYDKLSTGKTGLAHLASNPANIDFQVYLDEARSAYDYLKTRPEFDPNRMMILGHSEGGLIALVLADQLKASQGVKALVLAAPLSRPYLTTIHDQIAAQYTAAVKAGAFTQAQADAAIAELEQINKSLLETGKYPPTITTPALKQLFTPVNEKFLAQVGKYDPQKLAAGLPATMPVLAMCGQKDQQVSCDDVKYLMQGFQQAGNAQAKLVELAKVDHVFKEVPGTPNPTLDYGNPNLKFSQEATQNLSNFAKSAL